MKLKVEQSVCELWFDKFSNGFPQFRGSILFNHIDREDNFEFSIRYPIILLYQKTPYQFNRVGIWKLSYIDNLGRTCLLYSVCDTTPERWKFNIPEKDWVININKNLVLCYQLIVVVTEMSRLLTNLKPFSYNIFSEIETESKNWIRQIFLIFRKIVRLPEEMILKILQYINVVKLIKQHKLID